MTTVTLDRPRLSSRGEDTDSSGTLRLTKSPVSDNDIEYEEIEETDNAASFQGEEEDIAEYWDPYCEFTLFFK